MRFWRFNEKEKVIATAVGDPVAEPERYLDFLQYLKEVSDLSIWRDDWYFTTSDIKVIKFSTRQDFLLMEEALTEFTEGKITFANVEDTTRDQIKQGDVVLS